MALARKGRDMAKPTRRDTGTPSRKLTFQDAVKVWLMYWTGEFQNRIAAHFDCNPARISEIIHGYRFPGSEDAARGMRH